MNIPEYQLAPVCLFVYKRLDTLKQAVKSLLQNELAALSDLYVFSDAAASEKDIEAVNEVRRFVESIKGFKSIAFRFSQKNNGLAKSVIDGVTDVINRYDKVIVLEDDLMVSDNFLSFMNESLEFYKNNNQMFSVAGYTMPIKTSADADVYFTKRASCWGWGTWKNRWENIDWTVSDFETFSRDKAKQKEFNKMGSDLSWMLKKQIAGKINSWAIRWTYEQFKRNTYTVFPIISKVTNEGFGGNATHTSESNKSRFSTALDRSTQSSFQFPENPFISTAILKQFTDRYSIKTRVIYKIKSILN